MFTPLNFQYGCLILQLVVLGYMAYIRRRISRELIQLNQARREALREADQIIARIEAIRHCEPNNG